MRFGVALGMLGLGMLGTLAGCHASHDEISHDEAGRPKVIAASDSPRPAAGDAVVENHYGTPVKDRVATLGLLNKRNDEEQDVVLKSGETRQIGNVVIKLATCEKTAPWEQPPETGAFVQFFVQEHATPDAPLRWGKVFSGWLFKNSPSLNVVQHPVYDVWVKDCAMNFPGEDDSPAAAAASSKAAKASGSGRAPSH